MENKYTTYKGKFKKGYLGDFETEWWTQEDWDKHNKHVEELKKSGEYGKEYESEITLINNPIFDKKMEYPSLESHRIIFLNNNNG